MLIKISRKTGRRINDNPGIKHRLHRQMFVYLLFRSSDKFIKKIDNAFDYFSFFLHADITKTGIGNNPLTGLIACTSCKIIGHVKELFLARIYIHTHTHVHTNFVLSIR